MTFSWAAHEPAADEQWDAFVAGASNGTVLHSRRFLGYHGTRFVDRSMVLRDEREQIAAVMPIACDPVDQTILVSHPGATYGGLVSSSSLRGEAMVSAIAELASGLARDGYKRLSYKAVPVIYQRRAMADDLHALSRLGATQSRCELSAAVDLAKPLEPDRPLDYGVRRAARTGVEVRRGWEAIEAFWGVIEASLAERYGAAPTHSLAEIEDLKDRCPDELDLIYATLDGEVVAGTVLLMAGAALHTQYIASTEAGRRAYALEPVLADAVEHARSLSARYFSFGTSSTDGGLGLNDSLYRFKLSFGAGSVQQQRLELLLTESMPTLI